MSKSGSALLHPILRLTACCALILIAGACAITPPAEKTASPCAPTVLRSADETHPGKQLLAQVAAHPGLSGFYLLTSGMDAFLARALMATAAGRSIDLQYYIIEDEPTTQILLHRILAAADRGVRVRMLIDGIHGSERGLGLAGLNAHPNIQVRIFNPSAYRWLGKLGRPFEYLLRWDNLNRRMHNKLFIVDGQSAIVGGRNLADGYYEARPGVIFMDLDLWAVGPIVQDLNRSFNEYWWSASSISIRLYKPWPRGPADVNKIRRRLADEVRAAETIQYAVNLKNSDLLQRLERGDLKLIWARVEITYDKPGKADGKPGVRHNGPEIRDIARQVAREIVFVSPYFIPQTEGMRLIADLRRLGVRVLVITNSSAATDIVPAYAAFARYCVDLLRLGVEIYEIKPTAEFHASVGHKLFGGDSLASLHAKAYIFDRRAVYIGSFNLDPRSKYLNTEIGLVVYSPELAAQVYALVQEATQPRNSYHLMLATPSEARRYGTPVVRTTADQAGRPVRRFDEPGPPLLMPLSKVLLRLIPMEPLL